MPAFKFRCRNPSVLFAFLQIRSIRFFHDIHSLVLCGILEFKYISISSSLFKINMGSLSPPLIYGLVRTRSDAIVDPQLHYLPLGGFFKYDVLEEYDMRRQCPQLFTIKVKPGTRHSTQQNIIIFQVLKHLNIQKVGSIRVHFFRQTAHMLIF